MPQSNPEKPLTGKSRRRWPWILGFIVLVLAIVAFATHKKEKNIPVTIETIGRRDIIQLVSATGKIQPALEVKISAEVAGEIIEMPVIEGQTVKKGDLIVKIKPDVYQAQVEQQEAALNASRADNLMRKSQLLKAERDLQRQKDLFEKHIASDSEIVEARTARDVADATFQSSAFEIKRAEGQLSQIREELVKTSIYAPNDGQISLLSSKLGERVVATGQFTGTEIMRVADLTDMEVQADVNENDVVSIHPNDVVKISIDAYPDRSFQGKVTHIASTATVTGANTSEEVTNFQVKVQIVNPGVPLRPGMSATADIQTATVKNVIAAPIQSVTVRTKTDGKSMIEINQRRDEEQQKSGSSSKDTSRADRDLLERVVFLKNGGKAVMKRVSTGLSDNSFIEIKSGLNVGDVIINGSYGAISRLLKDGSPVEIEQPKKDEDLEK